MKHCETCGEEFNPYRPSVQRWCSRKCRGNSPQYKEKTRQFQAGRREAINKIKIEKGCERCGFNEHPAALCFDHIDPSTKSFNVSQDPKRAWGEMLAEIEKCRVLCSNCHTIHTYNEKHWQTARKDRT